MSYNLELSDFSLKDYKELLKNQNLLPGRRILWQDIDLRFSALTRQGISNVARLKSQLSTPKKIASLSEATGIPADYLTVLKREIGTLVQKPVPLASFPGVDEALLSGLAERGIKNSKDFYDSGLLGDVELSGLCDLVRINGVGPVAARVFFEAGFRSAALVAVADAKDMLAKVSAVNNEKKYYKAKLGEKDMQFCIDFAALLVRHTL